MISPAGAQHMAGKVILMLSLLEKDDYARLLVVQETEQGVGAPFQQGCGR